MGRAARTTSVFAALAWLSLTGCGSAGPTFVAWPEVGADTIVFVVSQSGGRRTISGPFSGASASMPLFLEEPDAIYVLALDSSWLRERHPRIDPALVSQTRLVDPPAPCSQCDGACRLASDERIYHPIGDAGRTWVLGEDGFVSTELSSFAALYVEIPARWSCEERIPTAPIERVERWPEDLYLGLEPLEEGRWLVLGAQLHVLGSTVAPSSAHPGLSYRAASPFGDLSRLFVAAGSASEEVAGGYMFEIDARSDQLSWVRESRMPFPSGALYADEQGLVVAGRSPEIATSTDGVHYDFESITFGAIYTAVAKEGEPDAPFLLGGNSGALVRGDPWDPEVPWTFELVAVTDSSIYEIRALEADADHPREVWAKTVERGTYLQVPELSTEWFKVEAEVASTWPQCGQAKDECGFTRLPEKSLDMDVVGRRVLMTARNCPALLVVRRDEGCASSVELRLEDGLAARGLGIGIEGESALVVVPDGVVRVPIDGL